MAIPFMRVVPILRIFDVVKADEFYLGDLKPQGRLASPRTPRGGMGANADIGGGVRDRRDPLARD